MDANLRTEKSGVRRLAKRDEGRLKGDFCVAGGNAPRLRKYRLTACCAR